MEGEIVVYQKPTAPLSIGQLLDSGFRLYRDCFKNALPLALGLGFLPAAVALLIELLFGGDSADMGYLVAQLVSGLFGVVVMMVLSPALIKLIDTEASGTVISSGEAVRVGLGMALRFTLTWILYSLALMVGFLLLIVPGVILGVSLSMSFYAVVLDDKGAADALRHSRMLTRGSWWRLAGIYTIMAFVYMALYGMLFFLVGAFGAFADWTFLADPVTAAWFNLANGLISAFIIPLTYGIGLAVYYDLELRRQGEDLAARIAATEPSAG